MDLSQQAAESHCSPSEGETSGAHVVGPGQEGGRSRKLTPVPAPSHDDKLWRGTLRAGCLQGPHVGPGPHLLRAPTSSLGWAHQESQGQEAGLTASSARLPMAQGDVLQGAPGDLLHASRTSCCLHGECLFSALNTCQELRAPLGLPAPCSCPTTQPSVSPSVEWARPACPRLSHIGPPGFPAGLWKAMPRCRLQSRPRPYALHGSP